MLWVLFGDMDNLFIQAVNSILLHVFIEVYARHPLSVCQDILSDGSEVHHRIKSLIYIAFPHRAINVDIVDNQVNLYKREFTFKTKTRTLATMHIRPGQATRLANITYDSTHKEFQHYTR